MAVGSYTINEPVTWRGIWQGVSIAVVFDAGPITPDYEQQYILDEWLVPQGFATNPNGQTGPGSVPPTDPGTPQDMTGWVLTLDSDGRANFAPGGSSVTWSSIKPAGGIPISDLATKPVLTINGTVPDALGNVTVSAGGTAPVTSVAGRIGDITLAVADVAGAAAATDLTDETNRARTAEGLLYTKPAGGIPVSDLATKPVLTVNGTAPDLSGNVAVAGGSGAVTSVAGRTGDIVLAVADVTGAATTASVTAKYTKPSGGIPTSDLASKPVLKVNGATPDSTGAVTVQATVSGLVVANLTVFDDGATDNAPYWQSLNDATTGPTTIIIPSNPKKAGCGKLNLSDHVNFQGGGRRWGKASYGSDAGGTCLCVADGTTTPAGTLAYMIKAGNHTQVRDLTILGYTNAKVGLGGPCIWVFGAGGRFIGLGIDTGKGPAIFFDQIGTGYPGNADSIDPSVHDCTFVGAQFHGQYFVRTSQTTATSGNVLTLDSVTDLEPGDVALDCSNTGFLDPGSIVTAVNTANNTVTVYGDGIKSPHSINGNTILFVRSATGLVNDSDIMFGMLRSLTSVFICAGADAQFGLCHFSGGTTNHIHNMILMSGQGQTFGTVTFDNAVGGTDGHILRLYGPFNATGCRAQSGIAAGGAPMCFMQDPGTDTQHGAMLIGLEVEMTTGLGVAIDALVCYSKYLYDNTSGLYKAIAGNVNAQNPNNILDAVLFSKGSFNRADAKGNPILCTVATATPGAPSTAATATWSGPYGVLYWTDDGSPISTTWTMGPQLNPHP